jgi:hypothetical protein
MKSHITLALAATLLIATQSYAEVIFRYKTGMIQTTSGGGGGGSGGGHGGTTDPGPPDVTPVKCSSDNPNSGSECSVTTDRPSTDPDIEPLRMTQVATPASADTTSYRYRCLKTTGGYGNYIYEVGGSMPEAVRSLDFVPAFAPNMPSRGISSGFRIPGRDGDFNIVTPVSDVCIRLSLDSEIEFETILTNVYVGDYADNVVVDGKANWSENTVNSEYAINLTITGDGTDNGGGDGECSGSTCGTGTVVEDLACPAGDVDDQFNCVEAKVSKPEADPDTPRLEFKWLPNPPGAYTQYHGYRCFEISGGNGNYAITARDTDYEPWVTTINVLPYSQANDAGLNFNTRANYPGATWTPEELGRQHVTNQRQFCVRVTSNANYAGDRDPANVEVVVKDYTSTVMSGSSVSEDQKADSYLMFGATLAGGPFYGAPSWQAVSFSSRAMTTEQYSFGQVTQPTSEETGEVGDTRREEFFYQCFEFSGGPKSSWHYFLNDAWPSKVPAWVEWWDIRPYSQIRSSYVPKEAGSPGSDHQYWPMEMDGQERALTDEPNICVRIKPVAGSTNKDTFNFNVGRLYNDVNNISGGIQHITLRWEATPL